jgi:methylenetetrahydrofolate dehydrogenase (NADP+) / methenyltetrahydrofolate cyclohydrolase
MTWAAIIDGRALAAKLNRVVRDEVTQLRKLYRLSPGLAMVLVGDHEASRAYVHTKDRACDEVGIRSLMHRLPVDVREEELLTLIRGLNLDVNVNGILIQLPLPAQIRPEAVLTAIDPDKDVDGFHVINAGRLVTGDPRAMVPCTPFGCMQLIGSVREDLAGLRAVVLGRSNIVGKPMAQLLLAANCTVTIAHSRSRDLAEECRSADILVAAVGRPAMVKGDWVKPGAIVIDVGISRIALPDGKTKLVGDVDYEAARTVAGAITPVPGGVGPMTVASLMRNTVIAACRQRKMEQPDL